MTTDFQYGKKAKYETEQPGIYSLKPEINMIRIYNYQAECRFHILHKT